MPYYIRNGKLRADGLSIIAATHCNLHCADCCAVACYQPPSFPDVTQVAADLELLGAALHVQELRLLGGEPLLNPQLGELASLGKRSGVADRVALFTNGRLLDRMDEMTWRHIDLLSVSVYTEAPPPPAALAQAEQRARELGIRFRVLTRHRFETRVVNEPHPPDGLTRFIYRTCRAAHYDHCHRVHEGRLYRCYIPLALPEYLRRLGRDGYEPDQDSLLLHPEPSLMGAVTDYLMSPEPLEACRYCLGSVGRRHAHRQLTRDEIADPGAVTVTRSSHLSPLRVALQSAAHLRHLAADRLRGGL